MAIGPVQLIVLGFPEPNFHGRVVAELERLRGSDLIRVIDALAVHKDVDGDLEAVRLSNLADDEAADFGSVIGALIGLGIESEEGTLAGARAVAEPARRLRSTDSADWAEGAGWDVLGDIPNGTAAALLLIEHHWAVPLRDAVASAGGHRIGDGFVSPLDLAGVGLVSEVDALRLHDLETAPSR